MLSAQSSPLTLPLDVWFLVFDELSPQDFTSDLDILHNTLYSCALTCQSWLPRTRILLYGEVFLDREEACNLLSRTLKESPDLGALVRKINLQIRLYGGGLVCIGIPARSPPSFPLDVVEQLINLSELSVRSWGKEMLLSSKLVSSIQSFAPCRTLSQLNLDSIKFPSMRRFLRGIRSFPQVSTLRLENCAWIENDLEYAERRAYTKKYCKNLVNIIVRNVVFFLHACSDIVAQSLSRMVTRWE